MLELRLKSSELSIIENCFENIYSLTKKHVQRLITSSYTTYLKSDRLQTIRNQRIGRKVKGKKFIIFANSLNLENMDLNLM